MYYCQEHLATHHSHIELKWSFALVLRLLDHSFLRVGNYGCRRCINLIVQYRNNYKQKRTKIFLMFLFALLRQNFLAFRVICLFC
jgi:hypothetical protein